MRIQFTSLMLIFLALSACSAPAATPLPGAEQPPTLAPSPTPQVSPTPGAPLAILLLPADLNEDQAQAYQKAVYELAQNDSMRFQVRNKLETSDLEAALKVVIALPPAPDLTQLAAAAPQTQFLAVNLPDLKPGGNLSTLGAEGLRVDQQAFIAGFIAATITQDYRTGTITRKDDPNSQLIQTAFRAGQEFFCGLCNPYAGPWEEYPLNIEIPSDAKTTEYGAYADFLLRKQVDTLFLQPGIDAPDLLEYLATVGAFVIGTQTPARSYTNWVVTLQPNYVQALKSVWPQLLAGNGGQAFSAPLTFTDANPEIFTPGKQTLAQKTLDDLTAGFILPVRP